MMKVDTLSERIKNYRQAYRIAHGRDVEVKTFPGGWCRIGDEQVAKYRISKLPEMTEKIMERHKAGWYKKADPISVVDVAKMTDTELILKIDAVARKNNIHDGMEDDTVLWQQLLIEVKNRLSKKGG